MLRPLAKSLKTSKEFVLDLSPAEIISSDQGDKGIRDYRLLLAEPEVSAKLVSYKPWVLFSSKLQTLESISH